MFIRYNFFTILWAILIAAVTLSSSGSVATVYAGFYDKIIHGTLFMLLSLLMIIAFHKQYTFTWVRFNPIKSALVVTILYGAMIEAAQHFVPGRFVEISDLIANIVGTFVGLGVFWLLYKL